MPIATSGERFAPMPDYSQFGQALLIEQLLTEDMPRIVVDIGAHDAVIRSNSRRLIEAGWRAVLVEPIPVLCERLRMDFASYPSVSVVNAAIGPADGSATMHVGRHDAGELLSASFLKDISVTGPLDRNAIQVQQWTLAALFRRESIPDDFGVLLIDAEGADAAIVRSLAGCSVRPRILLTEDAAATNAEKYALLREMDYRFLGRWGCDSLWVHASHPEQGASLRYPLERLPETWMPRGNRVSGNGHVFIDPPDRGLLVGWAFVAPDESPPAEVVLVLTSDHERYVFRAHRTPRPDVARDYGPQNLLLSGFRAAVDVPSGNYHAEVIQVWENAYTQEVFGEITVP